MDSIKQMHKEINLIKQSLIAIERNSSSIGDWLPRKAVMRFFDYGETQMRELEKSKKLEISVIGRRKFYNTKSINNLINLNKQK
jgi:hypothetical protein